MGPGVSSSHAQGPQELLHHSSAEKVAKERERMLREGFMPAAGAFSEEILEMPPSAPWTNILCFLRSCIGCNKLLLQGVYRAL